MGPCAPSEPVPFSSGFVATLSAGSFAPTQSISRVDCVETHGFGGVESVPRAMYISTPSKPAFFSSGLAVTSEHAAISGFSAESSAPVHGTSRVDRNVSLVTSRRSRNTLSDFFPVKSDKKKGHSSRNVSPATPPCSRNKCLDVSWSDSPRDQAVPKSEDAVMEDCTESHQAEINRKIRANDKLRKILTNMPDEHKSLIYGDSLKAKNAVVG